MESVLLALQLANALAPSAAELIMILKKKDGSVSVITILDEADAKFAQNLDQIKEWLRAHPQ